MARPPPPRSRYSITSLQPPFCELRTFLRCFASIPHLKSADGRPIRSPFLPKTTPPPHAQECAARSVFSRSFFLLQPSRQLSPPFLSLPTHPLLFLSSWRLCSLVCVRVCACLCAESRCDGRHSATGVERTRRPGGGGGGDLSPPRTARRAQKTSV